MNVKTQHFVCIPHLPQVTRPTTNWLVHLPDASDLRCLRRNVIGAQIFCKRSKSYICTFDRHLDSDHYQHQGKHDHYTVHPVNTSICQRYVCSGISMTYVIWNFKNSLFHEVSMAWFNQKRMLELSLNENEMKRRWRT